MPDARDSAPMARTSAESDEATRQGIETEKTEAFNQGGEVSWQDSAVKTGGSRSRMAPGGSGCMSMGERSSIAATARRRRRRSMGGSRPKSAKEGTSLKNSLR